MQNFQDFIKEWEVELNEIRFILDYLNSYSKVNEILAIESLISSKALLDIQEDWFSLHSKYSGMEKEFFKNYWVPLSPSGYDQFIDMSHPGYKVFSISFIPIEPYEYVIQETFTSIAELMSLLDSNIDIEEFNSILKDRKFIELQKLLENRPDN